MTTTITTPETTVRHGQRITMTAADSAQKFEQAKRKLDHMTRVERRWKRLVLVIGAALLLLGAYVIGSTSALSGTAADLAAQGADRDRQIEAIQQDLQTVCRQVPAGQLPTDAQARCYRAEGDASQVPQQAEPISDAEVLQAVKVRIDEYLDTHPMPTATDLLPLVRQVYEQNRPADGQDGAAPTDTQLLTLIQRVYDADPPQDGQDATPEMVDESLARYCQDQPGGTCEGPPGQSIQGDPGRGIVSRTYAWSEDGTCQEITEYTAPPTQESITVGAALCG